MYIFLRPTNKNYCPNGNQHYLPNVKIVFRQTFLNWNSSKKLFWKFFNFQGFVYYGFILKGKTVNKKKHIDIFHHLKYTISYNYPEKWTVITYDNAPSHCLMLVKQYLTHHSVMDLEHPPYPWYSPNF